MRINMNFYQYKIDKVKSVRQLHMNGEMVIKMGKTKNQNNCFGH